MVSILILSVSTGYGNEDIYEKYDQPCLYVVNSSGSVDYYMLDELAAFIQNNVSKPSDSFDNLSSVTYDPSCWAILFISNEEALTSMSEADRVVLRNAFDNGIVIGVMGGLDVIGSILGLDDKSSISDNSYAIHFLFKDKEAVHEFSPQLSEINDLIGEVMVWYAERVSRNSSSEESFFKNSSIPSEGAWNADYTKEYKGFQFEATTAYRLLINAYFLNTKNKDYDWALFSASIQTNIIDYCCSASNSCGQCGPFSKSMGLKAVVQNTRNGSKLYEYMPTGSIGSSSHSFTIGANLTGQLNPAGPGGQIQGTASYSESYTVSDATYIDQSSYVYNTAQWTVQFKGPSYTWYPFMSAPPSVAVHSYETSPAFIVQIPKGQCAEVDVTPSVAQHLDWDFNGIGALHTNHKKTETWDPLIKVKVCKTN